MGLCKACVHGQRQDVHRLGSFPNLTLTSQPHSHSRSHSQRSTRSQQPTWPPRAAQKEISLPGDPFQTSFSDGSNRHMVKLWKPLAVNQSHLIRKSGPPPGQTCGVALQTPPVVRELPPRERQFVSHAPSSVHGHAKTRRTRAVRRFRCLHHCRDRCGNYLEVS